MAGRVSSKLGSMLQGAYCGEQPYKVIAMCILAIGVCCLGLLRFQVETDPQRLWVGSASLAAREKAQYEVTPFQEHLPAMFLSTTKVLLHLQRRMQRGAGGGGVGRTS